MKNSMGLRVLAPVLLVVTAGAVPLVPGAAVAAPQADQAVAKCQVHAVLMVREGDGRLPKDLEFLSKTLKSDAFALYQGFYLVDRKMLALTAQVPSEAKLASGHKLGLTFLGADDKRIKIHAQLSARDGQKSLLSTDYSIDDDGLLMISAGSYAEGGHSGKLFIAIQCGRHK